MRDFRAWYGVGQAHEILKMSLYRLYYYRMAQSLKPDDSRMLVALEMPTTNWNDYMMPKSATERLTASEISSALLYCD